MTQNLWSRWIENDPTLTINDRKRIHLAGLKITGDTDHYRALIEDIGLNEEQVKEFDHKVRVFVNTNT